MGKVIKFPEIKSKKARELRKAEGRRVFLTLSMVSLVLMAVFLNDQVVKSYRPVYVVSDNSVNGESPVRNIASSNDAAGIYRDLQWEQELAAKLRVKQDSREPAALANGASPLDQMRFGELQGRYQFEEILIGNQLAVKALQYTDSTSANGDPIQVPDLAKFLLKYRESFVPQFHSVKRSVSSVSNEEAAFDLLNKQGDSVGQAKAQFDSNGRLISLSFLKK